MLDCFSPALDGEVVCCSAIDIRSRLSAMQASWMMVPMQVIPMTNYIKVDTKKRLLHEAAVLQAI
jgi:hypothetical protein